MSWGTELWDQYENIGSHTHKGIEFLDKIGAFVKERCAIENEYASKLRRLVKNHHLKKKDEDCQQSFTYLRAFSRMLSEITDLAGQHEVIAENMMESIVKNIGQLVREMKDERKRILCEGAEHQNNLNATLLQLAKAKKSYEKAFHDAKKAHDNFVRVDADYNLSRAEVDKAKTMSNMKSQLCERSKSEYATQLQLTNKAQRGHFTEQMPMVFQRFQAMEERRIGCIKTFIRDSAVIQQNVNPIIDRCLEGIIEASNSIDIQVDCAFVVECYKSGIDPPGDLQFEDLADPHTASEPQKLTKVQSSRSFKDQSKKRTLIPLNPRKRIPLPFIFGSSKTPIDDGKDDYAELPPNQRRKRIQGEIDKIKAEIIQETNVRDGLMKMKQVYEQNHALGDPMSLQSQLTENSRKMEELQAKLRQTEALLAESNGANHKLHLNNENSPIHVRKSKNNSLSEDSLSRSASDSSVSHKIDPSTPLQNSNDINVNNHNNEDNHKDHYEHVDSATGNRNIEIIRNNDTSNASSTTTNSSHDLPNGKNRATDELEPNGSFNHCPGAGYIDEEPDQGDSDPELLPALGTAKALFAFTASSEGSLSMQENEEFEVLELDTGDGWTRVRRTCNSDEGFAPTSWLKLELYS